MKILSVKLALSCTILSFKQFDVCDGSAVFPSIGGYFFKSDRKQLICCTWTPHGVRALRAPALQGVYLIGGKAPTRSFALRAWMGPQLDRSGDSV